MNASEQYVKSLADALPKSAIAFDILNRFGRVYEPKVTDLTGSMELGMCYRNSLNAMDSRQFYCEGYAVAPGLFPMEHAWIVDIDGKAIDPTWSHGTDYFGVKFKNTFVNDFALRTGRYGIFSNLYLLRMSVEEVINFLEEGIEK